MTLLSICQDAAREIGISKPGSIVGNTDPNAEKLLRYANKVGVRLMSVFPWQVLREEQTFTAIAGSEQTGILPSGFNRFVPETFWDRTNVQLVTGPITSVQWQGLKAGSYSGPEKKFIYRGGSVYALPAFSGGEALAFEYITENWCQSSGGTPQAAFAADTDVGLISEELITLGVIYEFEDGEGLPSDGSARDYLQLFDTLSGNDQPSAGVLVAADIFGGGRHFAGAPPAGGTGSIV